MAFGSLLGGFGGSALGRVAVEVGLDTKPMERDFVKTKAGLKGQAEGLGATLKAGLAVGAVAAGAAIVKFGVDSVKAFSEAQKVAAQTTAVLKSTGGAANVSADDVGNLASSLRDLTGVDDDTIQASENLLLTFRDIRNEAGQGNDLFNQTEKAILDMATAMNNGAIPSMENLNSTTIQVGKALNDPIKGMSALRRVGVAFTQQQQDQITALQESGHLMEAQKLVLSELQKEFGGAAKAAGDTFAGQMAKLSSHLQDIEEEVGKALVPALEAFVSALDAILPVLTPVIHHAGLFIRVLTDAATPLKYIPDLIHTLGDAFASTGPDIEDLQMKVWIFRHRMDEVPPVLRRVLGGMSRVTGVVRSLADAHQEAADKADAQRVAEQQLAGGALALRAAIIQLHRDQATLNKLTDEGKTGSVEYKDALGSVLDDQLSVNQSLRALGKSMADVGGGTDSVNGKIRTLAQQAGLSKAQIKALVAELDRYINKLHHIPTSVVTHVSVSGSTVSGVPIGKPLPVASGYDGMVTSPTLFLAGEAGPEHVQVTPQGRRGAGASRSLVIHNHFHGPVYGADSKHLARELSSRMREANGSSAFGLLGDPAV